MSIPAAGDQVPQLGNPLTRQCGRWLFSLMGWRVEGSLPNVPKMVAIGAPHTRNFDVVVGLGLVVALGVRVSWMAKHTVFRPPFRGIMRQLGGIPINRTASFNVVEQMVQKFQENNKLILIVMPEGSRSRAGIPVEEWKSGFYHIARGAGVPIFPVYVDNPQKRLILGPPLVPTEEKEVDLARLQAFYSSPVLKIATD